MLSESEEKVQDALLSFVDFLYAVVFGLVLVQLFEQVISTQLAVQAKAGKVLLVIGVFYFIAWDWMHGRLLTFRNPYTGYRRFFIEILIAASGYGAARSALNSDARFLLYLAMTLVLGVWWAHVSLKEVPGSPDEKELRFIRIYQGISAAAVCMFYLGIRAIFGTELEWLGSLLIIFIGYGFVFFYELFHERTPGLLGGPGVPYLGREAMSKIRSRLLRRMK